MHRRRGFTLIELMIVIAIIAVVAAIAIPGLLQSQRASSERSASASLKTLATAEVDFRSNDRDGNKVQDFWTRDVSGLYTAYPAGGSPAAALKLIDLSVAGADAFVRPALPASATSPGTSLLTQYAASQPKAGYWYVALNGNVGAAPPSLYATVTDATGLPIHNLGMFGFGCYPDSYSSGRQYFIISEQNTVFRRQTISTVRNGAVTPPGLPLAAGVSNGATDPPQNWPTDANLKTNYGKMD